MGCAAVLDTARGIAVSTLARPVHLGTLTGLHSHHSMQQILLR